MESLARALFKRFSILSFTVLLGACATAVSHDAQAGKKFEVDVPKETITEGGVFFASITSDEEINEASGLFQGRAVEFFPDGPATGKGAFHKYSAIVGVEYGTPPGSVDLSVKAKVDGESVDKRVSLTVKAGVYPSEKLRVPPKTVFPSKKEQKLIAKDRAVLAHAYATKTLTRFWDPPSVMPVDSDITSVFGTSRVYNGKKTNAHFGTDLRAPTGTPIAAPLSGQVAVARKLFYTGFTVILDHGYGLFTIYGHMSKLKVKEGELIKKGAIMGLSGATGRASGPHLHWGVNLHGTKVDPLVLVRALNQHQTAAASTDGKSRVQ